jgi:hypothetical protein
MTASSMRARLSFADQDWSGLKVNAAPFMQYRSPVGLGPSSNTWPRWPPQRRQCTAFRTIPRDMSVVVPTAFSSGAQKLGQPVPLSNFVADEKLSRAQPAHP